MALARDTIGLLFSINADSSKAKADLSEFRSFTAGQLDEIKNAAAGRLGILGDALGTLGPKGAAAAIGIGSVVTAAVAVSGALFTAAKAAEGFGGEIDDLQQITGLTAETLSTMKVIAEQGGVSLSEFGKGVNFLNRQMEAARLGAEDTRAVFDALGVDLEGDTEGALRVIAARFNELEDGALKTGLAIQIFGKAGASLLPTLNGLEGDLDKQIEKMSQLGVVIDSQAAAAAAKFGDDLDILERRLSGLQITIGNAVIPSLSRLAQGFDSVMASMIRSYDGLDVRIKAGITILQETLINPFAGGLGKPPTGSDNDEITSADIFRNNEAIAAAERLTKLRLPGTKKTGGGGGAGGAAREADSIGPDVGRVPVSQFERDREQRIKDQEKADQEFFSAITRGRAEFQRQQDSIQQTNDAAEFARLRNRARRELATEEETERQILAIKLQRLDEAAQRLTVEAGNDVFRQSQLNLDLRELMAEREALELESIARIRDAKDADAERDVQRRREAREQQREEELLDPSSTRSVFGDAAADSAGKSQGLLGNLSTTAGAALSSISDSLGNMQDIATGAFGSLAGGLQSLIEGFILTGQTGPAALKKLAAGVLASVAAQAAVKAIFEVAEGLAASARYDFVSASQHFAAAKTFGVVAAVAGVAGLALSASGGGAAASAGAAGGARATTQRDTRVIEQGSVRAPEPQIVIIKLEDPGITATRVMDDFRNNGISRRTLRGDLFGEAAT